jgi:hypothetical protein
MLELSFKTKLLMMIRHKTKNDFLNYCILVVELTTLDVEFMA